MPSGSGSPALARRHRGCREGHGHEGVSPRLEHVVPLFLPEGRFELHVPRVTRHEAPRVCGCARSFLDFPMLVGLSSACVPRGVHSITLIIHARVHLLHRRWVRAWRVASRTKVISLPPCPLCPLPASPSYRIGALNLKTKNLLFPQKWRQSLVYGEIDFWSFYDVVRAAADGIDTVASNMDSTRTGEISSRELSSAATSSSNPSLPPNKGADRRRARRGRDERNAGGGALGARAACHSPGAERESGLKFYDLGSGSGKAVFAAVLAADFR